MISKVLHRGQVQVICDICGKKYITELDGVRDCRLNNVDEDEIILDTCDTCDEGIRYHIAAITSSTHTRNRVLEVIRNRKDRKAEDRPERIVFPLRPENLELGDLSDIRKEPKKPEYSCYYCSQVHKCRYAFTMLSQLCKHIQPCDHIEIESVNSLL